MRDKIEDERAAGSTLTEAAKKLGLNRSSHRSSRPVGARARWKAQCRSCRRHRRRQRGLFSDVGIDTEALQLPSGGYLYFDVIGITPSRERTLEEVKEQVETRFHDDEVAKRLLAKANDIVGKLKAGTPFAQVADETGLKVATATDLQRGKQGGFVPAKIVDFVFRTPKGAAGTAEGEKPRNVRLSGDRRCDPTLTHHPRKERRSTTRCKIPTLTTSSANLSRRLENDFGVKINPAAMNQAIGGGTQQ